MVHLEVRCRWLSVWSVRHTRHRVTYESMSKNGGTSWEFAVTSRCKLRNLLAYSPVIVTEIYDRKFYLTTRIQWGIWMEGRANIENDWWFPMEKVPVIRRLNDLKCTLCNTSGMKVLTHLFWQVGLSQKFWYDMWWRRRQPRKNHLGICPSVDFWNRKGIFKCHANLLYRLR